VARLWEQLHELPLDKLLDDGMGVSLVLWKPVIEQQPG